MSEPEQEPRLFTLPEAERTRAEVEPLLIEAVEKRREMGQRADELQQLASRISLAGGMIVNYEDAARLRAEHDHLGRNIQEALERIHATGCVVKDLDMGLLDFPAIVDNEEVYLCWRLGEDRIRFYHRQDEGFAGRKPLDPNDPGPRSPIQ